MNETKQDKRKSKNATTSHVYDQSLSDDSVRDHNHTTGKFHSDLLTHVPYNQDDV